MRVLAAALLSSGGGGRSQSRREIESLSQAMVETHKRLLGQVGYTGGVSDPSSDTATDCSQKRAKVEKTSVKPREPGLYRKRNNGIFGKKGFRRNFESETRIFLSNVYHSQKIGRTTTCAELEVTESIPAKYRFQDGEHKKSSSYGSGSLVLTIDEEKTVRTKKFITFREKRLELSCKIVDTCFGKFNMVERQPIGLEWKIFSTGDPRSGTFYRRERFELGNCSGNQALFRPMEAAAGSTSNKCKGAISYSVCTKAATDTGEECFSTLRQQDFYSIHEETRMNLIQKPSEGIVGPMETLYIDGDETSTEVCSINTEPCGCSVETDDANRMVIIEKNFQQYPENFRRTRFGYVCDPKKHTAENFRKLEAKKKRYNDKRLQPCMEDMEAALLLSSTEFNSKNNSKSFSRKDDDYSSNFWVEYRNMVSGYIKNLTTGSYTDTFHGGSPRSSKRKVDDAEKKRIGF
ncbi:hypothetical protein AYI70_g2093 [Smittium culicis]|uniref:Uncharacterized protein n=1 Tax=Smittium culicis TaxID=133412 RepID=A0A1R1YA01_9FUNG|nr:hypothetical protein AYI70_g2093 [Smittium culicis]